MIITQYTNFVYFSDKILEEPYGPAYQRIKVILDRHNIPTGLLKGTKDICCRDYMPIQLATDCFVQFRYEPKYLKGFEHLQSEPKSVCEGNGIAAVFSDINLDGGNVVQWEDKVVVTDRIYAENPAYGSKKALLDELERCLECQVIVIPQIKLDMTGHADGLVRFFNGDTLIGNKRDMEYDYWQNGMARVVREQSLSYIDVPFLPDYKDKKHKKSAIGCYVNFLEVANLIIIPVFGVPGNRDEEVISLFHTHYPDRVVETVNINEVANEGGLLNCITWTIQR